MMGPRAPSGAEGRVVVSISGYSGIHAVLQFLPGGAQAAVVGRMVFRTYSGRLPGCGVVFTLPDGRWYLLDSVIRRGAPHPKISPLPV